MRSWCRARPPAVSLGQDAALGCEEYDRRFGGPLGGLRLPNDGLDALHREEEGFRLEHHAASASKGVVIDNPVLVLGVIPDVVNVYRCQSLIHGPLNDTLVKGPAKHIREEGQDVDVHAYWVGWLSTLAILRVSRAWGIAPITASRFSLTALGLPGRFMMRQLPRMPAVARLSIAIGVWLKPA